MNSEENQELETNELGWSESAKLTHQVLLLGRFMNNKMTDDERLLEEDANLINRFKMLSQEEQREQFEALNEKLTAVQREENRKSIEPQ